MHGDFLPEGLVRTDVWGYPPPPHPHPSLRHFLGDRTQKSHLENDGNHYTRLNMSDRQIKKHNNAAVSVRPSSDKEETDVIKMPPNRNKRAQGRRPTLRDIHYPAPLSSQRLKSWKQKKKRCLFRPTIAPEPVPQVFAEPLCFLSTGPRRQRPIFSRRQEAGSCRVAKG